MKEAVSSLHLPPTSSPKTTSLQRLPPSLSWPSVILAVDVFEVEVDQAGVCGDPCPRFPAYAGYCPCQKDPPKRPQESRLCASRAGAAKRVQSATVPAEAGR